MKKLLFLTAIVAMMFGSCKKGDEPTPTIPPVTSSINWNDSVDVCVKLISMGGGSIIYDFNIAHDSADTLVPMYPNYTGTIDSAKFNFRIKRNAYWISNISIGPTSVKLQYTLNGVMQKDTLLTPAASGLNMYFQKKNGNTDELVRIY